LNFVVRTGRKIAVETIEVKGLSLVRRRQTKAFAMMPLTEAASMFEAMNQPKAMVATVLCYQAWRTRGKPFALSNALLARYGVHRNTKYRALTELEAAGLIRLERRGKQALRITLLQQRIERRTRGPYVTPQVFDGIDGLATRHTRDTRPN